MFECLIRRLSLNSKCKTNRRALVSMKAKALVQLYYEVRKQLTQGMNDLRKVGCVLMCTVFIHLPYQTISELFL